MEQWKAAKGQAYLEYREGLCTKEAFLARKTALQTEILKNEEELASLKKQIEITEPSVNEAIECLEGCNRIEKLDRGLLEKLIDTVWVYDGERVKVDFTFKDLYSLS